MLNSTGSSVPDGLQPRSPDVIYVNSSSSPALTTVIACMTIMAVCAVAYFFIRWHFEEKRLKTSLALCKCPNVGSAVCNSNLEFGSQIPPACCYSERRAISVGVQANMDPRPPASTVSYWATSDVRVSEARRTGCKFSSPLPNNQAVPDWRPPATGSSNRPNYPFSQRRRPIPPHRRRGTLSMPSVTVQSASSSDSYSLLTMSHNSRSAALNKDLTAVTFSDEEQQNLCGGVGCSSSSRLEVHSTSPGYHPRYNTPVSETNEQETAVAVEEEEEEEEDKENENDEREVGVGEVLERGHRKRRSSSEDDVGRPTNGQLKGIASTTAVVSSTTTADGVTQSSTFGYVGGDGDSRGSQMPSSNSSSHCMNSATSGIGLFHHQHQHQQQQQHQLDTVRYGLPSKGSFPSCEYLPGGRLVTRWTQTDNGAASLVSLDWDNYDSERLRSVDVCGLHDVDDDDEELHSSSAYHDGEETRTLLTASHTTASDTTMQASRTSRTSTSSPYVLCFECSEEFSLNGNRQARRNILYSLEQQLSLSSPLTHEGGLQSPNHPTVPSRLRRKSLAPVHDLNK